MKQTLKMATFALAMSTSLFSVQSAAAGTETFTPEQQARIGEIAADYLVAHPDVLIEMSKKLQARQQAMQQQTYVQSALKTHRLLMQLDGVPLKGPADSKVIVTEFFDYECIACSMMAPVMEKVMAANAGVRFAFRDWTIFAARFPESAQASRRGLSIYRTHGADAYMAFHNGIYRTGHNEGKLTAEDIEKAGIAAGTGNVSDESNSAADQIIENNAALAEMLGLTGTPGIIVMPAENATPDNTTVIPGVVSEQVMQQAIARAEKG
ncbi:MULTISPECIES: DsbA family protein [unclassified Pantoea]|uniref:DsbA family protein n=1 Tax=unclassified Pantoea TaxID=2630326 RepID=UPI002477BB71|nr:MULTISPECIES: DsbA family protein [unclassified Pantoea]GME47551.1 DsbA family protein [Pantoea sp. QMID3]GME47835.1 DsbA family protein [Pantoea sp. QMID1]GME62663.1 DsbA family protein [Pantoea sp. QMID4]GME63751.1 DsbA family protein [Pantoea sp. QMID2]